jgi:hypothetical protein
MNFNEAKFPTHRLILGQIAVFLWWALERALLDWWLNLEHKFPGPKLETKLQKRR